MLGDGGEISVVNRGQPIRLVGQRGNSGCSVKPVKFIQKFPQGRVEATAGLGKNGDFLERGRTPRIERHGSSNRVGMPVSDEAPPKISSIPNLVFGDTRECG